MVKLGADRVKAEQLCKCFIGHLIDKDNNTIEGVYRDKGGMYYFVVSNLRQVGAGKDDDEK